MSKRWHVSFDVPGSDMRDFTHVVNKATKEEAEAFAKQHFGPNPIAVEEPLAARCTHDAGYSKRATEATAENDVKQKHMERIRKLLNVTADRGATEAEAIVAMQKAHELCLQHEIDMEEALKTGTAGPVDRAVIIDKSMENKTNGNAWRRGLVNAIAKSMFCGYVVNGYRLYGQKGGWGPQKQVPYDRHAIVGTRAHIAEVKAMAGYLFEVCESLANDASLDYPKNQRASFVNSYLVGISGRLAHRLYERRRDAEQGMRTSDGRNLPALISTFESHDKENKAKVAQEFGELSKSRGPQVNDQQAKQQGWEDGEKVGLDRQIGGRGNQHRLGHG